MDSAVLVIIYSPLVNSRVQPGLRFILEFLANGCLDVVNCAFQEMDLFEIS